MMRSPTLFARAKPSVLPVCVRILIWSLAGAFASASTRAADSWVTGASADGAFSLVGTAGAAPIIFAAEDAKVVGIAANDLAADIERVTGRRPAVHANLAGVATSAVLIGTLGQSSLIDGLISAGKLDVADLRGKWESFVIATVAAPTPGLPAALVIAGSDRRGTAFGVYELSQAIGVSPWHWWADVTPARKDALYVAAGMRRFGPPSVKYRGIFINDEDWGLQPWAAKTFEPETGDIGPKTYAKVFELLLRLKANTLWPAMHAVTKPFNTYPRNKVVADEYAIVMGSSHAEPMLRNNVGEWTAPPQTYNYVTNRDGVLAYWEQRARENGKYENIYTLGMRGIHDSGIQGARTDAERIRVLEQTFADQRALIAKHVRPEVEAVPQMFCAYKEVLGLYRQGLKVPDDVTIVWPDDNFGFIRNFATAEEQKRPGGFGVYYHLSYLGAPMAYLWLSTTPPALVWEEMHKAYEHGARTIWIANVGDLKPAEIGTEFFLQMAWDIERWRPESLPQFLPEWSAREFGPTHAAEIAAIMNGYYELNFQRRPEHLQGWLPRSEPRPSAFTRAEARDRLARFEQLARRAEAVTSKLPAAKRDAFYELVEYPVVGSKLANDRFFHGEFGPDSHERAKAADAALREKTRRYNEDIAGGKWRNFMRLEPADDDWRSMRIAAWTPPGHALPADDAGPVSDVLALEAENFSGMRKQEAAAWTVIPGLGRTGGAVTILPTTTPAVDVTRAAASALRLEYSIHVNKAGTFPVTIHLLPTHPIRAGAGLRFALGIDDEPPQEVVVNVRDGSPDWAQGVLNNTVTGKAHVRIAAPGAHTLRLYGLEPGVVIDKIVIDLGGLKPSYLGPPAPSVTR